MYVKVPMMKKIISNNNRNNIFEFPT
jgi:hypothetical protein